MLFTRSYSLVCSFLLFFFFVLIYVNKDYVSMFAYIKRKYLIGSNLGVRKKLTFP